MSTTANDLRNAAFVSTAWGGLMSQAADELDACHDLLNHLNTMVPGEDVDVIARLSAALGVEQGTVN